MDLKYYHALLKDDLVIKCNGELDYQCKTTDDLFSIGVYYNSDGIRDNDSTNGQERILFTIYPGAYNELLSCKTIDNSVLFMVNSDSNSLAYTYKLAVHKTLELATLQVHDMPEVGRESIAEVEIEGISKTILASHKVLL